MASVPRGGADRTYESLNERPLRGSAEVRLPDEAGDPLALVASGDGLVVLESVTKSTPKPTGDSSTQELFSQSELRLRKLNADSSTAWVVDLGTFVEWYLVASHDVIDVEGDEIRVVWPRYDGALPAALYGAVPATVVESRVSLHGLRSPDREIRTLTAPGHPPAFGVPWILAVDHGGSVIIGSTDGDVFTIEQYDPSSTQRWIDQLRTDSVTPAVLSVGPGGVFASAGGGIVAWDPAGRRQWEQHQRATALAPVDARVGGTAGPTPALVLSVADGSGLCVLDDRGQPMLTASELGLGEPVRAWWGEAGLLVFSSIVATGTEQQLLTIDPAGNLTRQITVAGSGDIVGFPGSSVADVAATHDGGLAMVGSRSDYRPDHDTTPGNLENWRFLIRFAPPAATGDLTAVPVLGH